MNPVIKFTTLFGLLAVELAVTLTAEGGPWSAMCWRRSSPSRWCSSGGRSTGCGSAAWRADGTTPVIEHLLKALTDPAALRAGTVGRIRRAHAIVFTETGLLIGFFLPGDSLLITAGLAAAGELDIWLLNVLLSVAAIVGDSVGYAIGYRAGPHLHARGLAVVQPHLVRTREVLRASRGRPSSSPGSSRSSGRSRRWWPAWDGWTTGASRLQRPRRHRLGRRAHVGGYLLGRTIPDIHDTSTS